MTRTAPTPQPTLLQRAHTIAMFPVGLAVSTARYLWWRSEVRRSERAGTEDDLPPRLPADLLDDEVKTLDGGSGPVFHRLFRVDTADGTAAEEVMDRVTADLDRAAPSEVVSFRKLRGRVGELVPGDEYRVRMPAPWDGPVRVVRRDATSFRFATLRRHLEAGQIEFRVLDGPQGPAFEIETWSRAGDRLADLAFDHLRVAKEIQLHMWVQFCLSVTELAGGPRVGPVAVSTARLPWSDDYAGADLPC